MVVSSCFAAKMSQISLIATTKTSVLHQALHDLPPGMEWHPHSFVQRSRPGTQPRPPCDFIATHMQPECDATETYMGRRCDVPATQV